MSLYDLAPGGGTINADNLLPKLRGWVHEHLGVIGCIVGKESRIKHGAVLAGAVRDGIVTGASFERVVVGTVVAAAAFDAAIRVPIISAVRPRQTGGEGGEEIVQDPSQNDVVITLTEDIQSSHGKTNTWVTKRNTIRCCSGHGLGSGVMVK